MAYALKYYMEYKDRHENLWRVELLQDGYIGGVVSEMQPSAAPFSTEAAAASTDKFSPIRVTTAVLRVEVDTDYQYMDLYTQNDKEFKVVAKCNGAAYYTGFLVAEEYGEPYTAPGYSIQLKATDGFNSLKDIPFVYETQRVDSLYNMLAHCLDKLALGLSVGCETGIYEIQMSTSSSTNALKQMYVYANAFDNETTASSCYDVLAQILMAANTYIVQANSKFQIRSIDRITSQVTNDAGDVLPATLRLQDATDIQFINNDMAIAVQRAWRRFTLKQEMKLSTNLIVNGDFNRLKFDEKGVFIGFRYWVGTDDLLKYKKINTYITTVSDNSKITTVSNARDTNAFDIVKEDYTCVLDLIKPDSYEERSIQTVLPQRMQAMSSTNKFILEFDYTHQNPNNIEGVVAYLQILIVLTPGVNRYYDFMNNVWSETEKFGTIMMYEVGEWKHYKKEIAPYTSGDFDLYLIINSLETPDLIYPTSGELELNNVKLTMLLNNAIAYPSDLNLDINITSTEGGEDLTVKLGDSPILTNALSLYSNVFSLDSNRTTMTHNWKRRKGLSVDIHTALTADLIRDEMKLPAQQLTCTFVLSNPFILNGLRCVTDAFTCGRHYMPMRLTYNTQASEMECEFIEMVGCAQMFAIWNDRVSNILAPSVPALGNGRVYPADNCFAALAMLYEGRFDEAEAMVFYTDISTFYNKAYFFTDGWHDDSEGSNTTSFFAAAHWLFSAAHILKLFSVSNNDAANKATVDTVVTSLFATIQTSGTYNGLFTTTAEPVPYFEPHCILVFAMKMLYDATGIAGYNTKYIALRDKLHTTFYRGITPQEYYAYKADVNEPNAMSLALGSIYAHKKNVCTVASRANMLNAAYWNIATTDSTAVEGIKIDTSIANSGKIDSVATLYTALANGYYGYHAAYIKLVKNLGQLLNPSNRLGYSNVRSFASYAQDEEGKTIRLTSGQQCPTGMYSLTRRWYKKLFDFDF